MSNPSTVVLETRVVNGSGGGPDKTILNTPRFLTPRGYRTLCAYMYPPADPGFQELRTKAQAWQAPLLPVADRGPWDWRVVTRMLDICRRERVTIWHGHDYKSNALGLLLRRLWPMHLVTTVHGWGAQVTRRTRLYNRLDRLCLPRYERVLCVSKDLHDECLACGVPAERCVLCENAINLDEYSRRRDRPEAKRALGLPPERLLVGAVGRLSAEKGFDVLVRAVDRLLGRGLDVDLVIVGEGGERPALEKLVAELGRGDHIRLLGYRTDTRDVYEAMDAYALSSSSEGLPNVLLEAMAVGVPVVATRVGGVPHLIRDGEDGLLIEPDSPDALAGALARLLGNADLRARLERAGRQTVEARYSFEARVQKIRAVYDSLLLSN